MHRQIRFGKITTKQVYRDIFRFWRVMLIDLLPEDDQLLEAVGLYLTWLNDSNAPAYVRVTLLHLQDVWADAIELLVEEFGAALYSYRVKVELHKHVPEKIVKHGCLRDHCDEVPLSRVSQVKSS